MGLPIASNYGRGLTIGMNNVFPANVGAIGVFCARRPGEVMLVVFVGFVEDRSVG